MPSQLVPPASPLAGQLAASLSPEAHAGGLSSIPSRAGSPGVLSLELAPGSAPASRGALSRPWHAIAVRLFAEGLGASRVARAIGIHSSTVRSWAISRGIPMPDNRIVLRRARGDFAPTVMVAERAAQAHQLAAEGLRCAEAARRMNVPLKVLAQWSARKGGVFPRNTKVPRGFLRNLTPAERKDYGLHRQKCLRCGVPFDAVDTLRLIGRPDLADAL